MLISTYIVNIETNIRGNELCWLLSKFPALVRNVTVSHLNFVAM
jgi:hypothetical protein